MKEFFDRDLICLDSDSQYEFIYNEEKLLSDSCFSNLYGDSYCYIGDTFYSNVTYKTIYHNCIKSIKYKDIILNPLFIGIIILSVSFTIIKKMLVDN